jgi:hypothetical protein
MGQRELSIEKAFTPGMKRRAVVRVLKDALRDSQREIGIDRVVGIFGVVIKEDGTASLLSAVTVDELRIVMKAIPAALQATSQAIVKGDKPMRGN